MQRREGKKETGSHLEDLIGVGHSSLPNGPASEREAPLDVSGIKGN